MKNGRFQILHVEDEHNRFQNYSRMVKGALDERDVPHEIIWADTLENAYAKVFTMQDELDLILLDISLNNMEGKNGLSLIRTMKEKHHSNIPIFVVSANIERYHEVLERFKADQIIQGFSEPIGETWPEQLPDILLGKCISLLHLSDIHNGKFFAYDNLVINRQTVLNNLCRKLEHIDFVIVSGDISSTNSEKDYHAASGLLSSLREKLSLLPQNFVFVPGNHDHDLACNNSHTFSRYLNFVDNFYGGNLCPDSHYPNHELEDYDTVLQVYNELFCVIVYPEYRTIIVGFNSVNPLDMLLNREKKCPVMSDGKTCSLVYGGEISSEQITYVDQELQSLFERRPEYKQFIKIATFHHNIFEPSHVEKMTWRPTLINQGNLLEFLTKHNFLFALHGHLHYKEVHYYKAYHKPYGLNVISTGTFSGTERVLDTDFCANKITYRVSERGQISFCKLNQLVLPRDGTDWRQSEIILNN